MLFLLSPAKSLDYETPVGATHPDLPHTLPQFVPQSQALIEVLRQKSPQQIAELMDLSDALSALNVARYEAWRPKFTAKNSKQAVLAFNGDVYEGLDAKTLNAKELDWAQNHVCILSGLYGVLRPLDWMQPYRLEMGTTLQTDKGSNLYKFWGPQIAEHLNERLAADKTPVIVNLASQEYFKAVQPKKLAGRAKGWAVPLVEQAAEELAKERYIVIDEGTEEVLIRSYIRNDEVMKQPNLVVAMVGAFAGVASREIRGVIRDEVWRLSVDAPELSCWGAKASKDLLIDMVEQSPARRASTTRNPSGKGFGKGKRKADDTLPDPLPDPFGTPSRPIPVPVPATTSPTETAPDASDAVLVDVAPEIAGETEGQQVNRLARVYTSRVKMAKFIAVAGVVKTALRTGDYTEEQIATGLLRLAEERRGVTVETLRIAIEGMPAPTKATPATHHVDRSAPTDVAPPEHDPFKAALAARRKEDGNDG